MLLPNAWNGQRFGALRRAWMGVSPTACFAIRSARTRNRQRTPRRGRYYGAWATGLRFTDLPQPQAEVWFGLLKTNCAASLSAL